MLAARSIIPIPEANFCAKENDTNQGEYVLG
jgi:hypothetical protein